MDPGAAVVEVEHAGVERMLHPPLQRVEVADGGAALEAARRDDRAEAASKASARQVFPAAAGPTSASVRIDSTAAPAPFAGLGMRLSPCAASVPTRRDGCSRYGAR
jgi:hypothetical protein